MERKFKGRIFLNKIDLNKIASYFNGGGHFNASGFESDLNSVTIIKKIKELIRKEKSFYD